MYISGPEAADAERCDVSGVGVRMGAPGTRVGWRWKEGVAGAVGAKAVGKSGVAQRTPTWGVTVGGGMKLPGAERTQEVNPNNKREKNKQRLENMAGL